MAIRGSIAKAHVAEVMAKAFGEDWIGEYNGKYYIWAKDGSQREIGRASCRERV